MPLSFVTVFEAAMVAGSLLCAYHAARHDTVSFYVGSLLYGFLLEQVAILVFDIYSYPLSAYLLTAFDVPLAIAFGWSAIIYSGYVVGGRYFGLSGVGLAAFTGLFGLHIDFVMDPVATQVGLWDWFEAVGWYGVPTDNFLGWFNVAFVYTLTYVYAARYVERGVLRLAGSLVVALPVLVGLFEVWLRLTGGNLLAEAAVFVVVLLAAGAVVARGATLPDVEPPRELFAAIAIFPVLFGGFYVVYGVYRTFPTLVVPLIAAGATTYLLFHPTPLARLVDPAGRLASREQVGESD